MPDQRRLVEEVDELMGTSGKKEVWETDASAVLHVTPVTTEVRRVTLKHKSVSLENRGSNKRKSREDKCKLCSAGTFISTLVIRHEVRGT